MHILAACSHYPRPIEATAASARKRHAVELFAGLPARYDLLGALFSFGQDPRWRRALVAEVGARPDERVLDVATGTGLVARELVRRYGCRVVGLDQSPQMLAGARSRRERDRALAKRFQVVEGEAERLPYGEREFDHLTFTYLLRYVDDAAGTLAELARVVRPGGRIAALEFAVPKGPLRWPWRAYTRIALPVGGLALGGRAWWHVGRFLGPSIEDLYRRLPLERQVELWRDAGIRDVRARRMSLGGGVVIAGTKNGS